MQVTLKDAKDWSLIGKPTRRLDAPDKVLGRTTYGIDVRLPDMLNAALVQCPVFKGTLKDGAPTEEQFADAYRFSGSRIAHRQTFFFRPAI